MNIAAVTSEEPFAVLNVATTALERGFEQLPDWSPVAIAPELVTMTGQYAGKVLTLRSSTFRARGIKLGRVVRIDGPGTWILNAVVFPEAGFATPILGIELLVFRERMHLIVADLFPLQECDAGIMDDIGPLFDDVGEPPEMPIWATRIFSRRPIFRKPRSTATLGDGASAVTMVSERWLSFARLPVAASDVHDARTRRDGYVVAHAEDEPANPFLAKTFGAGLGERLFQEVLFPVAVFR